MSENNFKTNIDLIPNGGEWTIDDETLSVSNVAQNQFYMSSAPVSLQNFTLETNIRYTKGVINIFFAAGGTNPFGPQAYTVQFDNGSSMLRLFRFGGDYITPSVDMGKQLNDGQFHNVLINKQGDTVIVWVDGDEKLNYQFNGPENFFHENTYVGIGLWDGALDVQKFLVNEIVSHTVTFAPGEGSGSMDTQEVQKGTNLTLPANGFTAPENKKFKAWGIGDARYNPGTRYIITEDTVVTALWADNTTTSGGACYVATAVYGSYDCPEVWTLRRFRDNVLARTWYGRLFIHLYYAVSPVAVRLFGETEWFQTFWRGKLDSMVADLQAKGFESTPYQDKNW